MNIMNKINELNMILNAFKIKASCVDYAEKDNYIYFDIKLESTEKISIIKKYVNEIAIALKLCQPQLKIEYSTGLIRIEFIYRSNNILKLVDYFTNKNIPRGDVICLLGKTIRGERLWMDLGANPHMLIAGTTGSGKSTLMHNIIANIFNYNKSHLILIDPKQIEFFEYAKYIKNYNVQVYYSYMDTIKKVDELIKIMNFRYSQIKEGVDLVSFAPIVFIVDEFADLIMQDKTNELHDKICILAQKCRAAKIFLILGTQRPSTKIISGLIKANFPARISCKVANHIESNIILDSSGAENLYGKGDALLKDNFRSMERFQIAYTTYKEVCNLFGELD